MSGLAERLREHANESARFGDESTPIEDDCDEAADRIEALEREVTRLKATVRNMRAERERLVQNPRVNNAIQTALERGELTIARTAISRLSQAQEKIMKVEPAYPTTVKRNTSSDPLATPREFPMHGLTKREWFAGMALQGIITATSAGQHTPAGLQRGMTTVQAMALDAFEIADAMIAASKDQDHE